MSMHSKWLGGALIYYDGPTWIEGVGPNLTKFILNTAHMPADDTTGDLSGFTHTAVEAGTGDSVAVLADNTLLITTAANENDGVNLQVNGEAFNFGAGDMLYFGINFQVSDAAQTDVLVGLCITDTDLLGGMTDGAYFESLDGSTDINFVLEKDSSETTSASAVGTLANATNVTLEFTFDGSNVDAYVNGVLQTRLATTNLPNDEQLTPSIHFLAGSAGAKTMAINWLRAFQIHA